MLHSHQWAPAHKAPRQETAPPTPPAATRCLNRTREPPHPPAAGSAPGAVQQMWRAVHSASTAAVGHHAPDLRHEPLSTSKRARQLSQKRVTRNRASETQTISRFCTAATPEHTPIQTGAVTRLPGCNRQLPDGFSIAPTRDAIETACGTPVVHAPASYCLR